MHENISTLYSSRPMREDLSGASGGVVGRTEPGVIAGKMSLRTLTDDHTGDDWPDVVTEGDDVPGDLLPLGVPDYHPAVQHRQAPVHRALPIGRLETGLGRGQLRGQQVPGEHNHLMTKLPQKIFHFNKS